MKKFFTLSLMAMALSAHAEPVPGQVLLDVFSASCPTSGEWTQAALNDSRSLIAVIDTIAKDEDCKTLTGAMTQLSTLNDQVTALATMSETKKQIAAYDAQERDLLVGISQSQNQIDIDNMTLNLRMIQMGRAALLGRQNAEREMSGTNSVLALSKAVQTANSSFAQIAANQRCQEKAPAILTTATGLMSSIGTAVSVMNPALGLGLQAGTSFIGTAVEQFRMGRFNNRIREAAEGSTAFMGYKCALETFTNRWCEMEEARAFLKYKTELRTSQVNQGLRDAIKLNDREIPVILDWLLKVKSGVDPQTTADGERQRMAIARKATLEALEAKGKAKINNSRAEFETVKDQPRERWALIRSIVNELAPSGMSYSSSDEGIKNPFHDIYPKGYIPYYLVGVPETDTSIQQLGNYVSLDNWTNPNNVPLITTLEELRANYLELVRLARIKVEREYTEVLRPDAAFTLASAYESPGTQFKISPMTSLKNLIAFLEKNPPEAPEFQRIYRGTIEKLKTIYDATETAVITEGMREGNGVEQESLERILMAADLTYGTVIIQARLELLVRISVLQLLEQSDPAEQVIVAQLLASDRFMDTLSTFTGKDDIGAIDDDLAQAMSVSSYNLNSFVKTFGKTLTKQLQRLVKEEREGGRAIADLRRRDRAQLCHLLLAAEKAADHVDVRYCAGVKLGPIAPGAPETKPLTAEDFREDLADRGCRIHDYNLARKIYTQWTLREKRLPVRSNR